MFMRQVRSSLAYGSSYRLRYLLVARHIVGVMVDIVSSEYLVSALAREYYLYLFGSKLADEEEGYRSGVGERFVHMVLYLREIAPVIFGGDNARGIFFADVL